MAPALCASIVKSKRSLLALGWHFVSLLTLIAFIIAIAFAASGNNYSDYNNNNNNNNNNNADDEVREDIVEIAMTSKAMNFAALWTGILAICLSVWGTILLGVQSPTGQYYSCCSTSVHKTTTLSLGAFIGALVMFSNSTLVCSVLFGEFHIRDYVGEGQGAEREQEQYQDYAVERSSTAFSIMCLFLTVLYAGSAGLVFTFHRSIIEENLADAREEALQPSQRDTPGVQLHPTGAYVSA
mmetsp:Transcript_52606/g.77976  ORF Transcript_52606/g.77976 Transcript_52606/m.77976 type:complete len:240 (-) Transcript_52606:134-853(-)|eukprot:CAMPEP_0195518058 /NCGR_PEP_ID=MMETSP0794_2-20130614/12072_1 /TAXON_ID=515487 /ORGANISM="Stephanopyxis turris, Strain CCMP 815" /LENGTH=239 /DNA_ID=CAMNT_0040646961 /DNA_START=109 /DNA_END=828 /DNA_ORIENTATION=-